VVSGTAGADLKKRMRTGTVVTTDDRNWELRYTDSALRFNQSRAVAIDMESATIAAQGYRFRVPYGTLLCVSDKPLHGEIKLPGQANRFYEEAIAAHLQIGIQTCELLREAGNSLHSRKLRAFQRAAVPLRSIMEQCPPLSRSIAGRVAIVTGAASGMGRATAILFASEGRKGCRNRSEPIGMRCCGCRN
jgi:hypothetical protein